METREAGSEVVGLLGPMNAEITAKEEVGGQVGMVEMLSSSKEPGTMISKLQELQLQMKRAAENLTNHHLFIYKS